MQHPAHDAAVHWHRPRKHSTPGSQAGPLPQRHSPPTQLSAPIARVHGGPRPHAQRPSAPHESAEAESQSVHALPPTPHADALVMVMQVPWLVQQPVHESQPDIGVVSCTVTGCSTPFFTVTRARPAPTTAPEERPSTKTSTVCLSSESGSSTRTVEVLGNASPARSGLTTGANTSSVS